MRDALHYYALIHSPWWPQGFTFSQPLPSLAGRPVALDVPAVRQLVHL